MCKILAHFQYRQGLLKVAEKTKACAPLSCCMQLYNFFVALCCGCMLVLWEIIVENIHRLIIAVGLLYSNCYI